MKSPGTHYLEMKMQQTKSYWRLIAVTGVVSAFIASACVVTTTTDDDSNAGSGGSGATAGSSVAGSPAAGAGTAGSHAGAGTAGGSQGGAGPVPFQCDPGEGGAVGKPNDCTPVDAGDKCQKCVQAKCCDLFEACYATEPGNQCGWGGPATIEVCDGENKNCKNIANEGGELLCIQNCLQKAVIDSGTAPDDSQVQTCGNNCATTKSNGATMECGSVLGVQTSEVVGCLRENCSVDCLGA